MANLKFWSYTAAGQGLWSRVEGITFSFTTELYPRIIPLS